MLSEIKSSLGSKMRTFLAFEDNTVAVAEAILLHIVSLWRFVLSKSVVFSDVIESRWVRIRAAVGWPDWIN